MDTAWIFEAWNNPGQWHAMLVHWPIVLSALLIPLTLVTASLPSNRTLRVLALVAAAVLGASAWLAKISGEGAEDAIPSILTPDVYQVIESHEEMGEKLWLFGAGMVLLLSIGTLKPAWARHGGAWMATALSFAAIGWAARTAHHGGTLVYVYGVGTPTPAACYDLPGQRADGRDHAAEHAAENPDPNSVDARQAFAAQVVMPIIAQKCVECHNPSRARRAGQLDQTTIAGLLKGGRSGPAIVPGKPEESLLLHRVRAQNQDDLMPPPPDPPLTEEELASLEQWIRDGAAWPVQP